MFEIKKFHHSYVEYKKHEQFIWGNCFKWLIEEINLNLNKKIKILDIGYGYGTILLYLAKNYKNLELHGIDIQEKLKHKDLEEYKNIKFYKFNFEEEDLMQILKQKFDIIICTETFEHFNFSPLDNFNKIFNLLKKNGLLYFSTPNKETWGEVNKYYQNYSQFLETKYNKNFFYIDDHFWHYSFEELNFLFKKFNLKIKLNSSTKNDKNLEYFNIVLRK